MVGNKGTHYEKAFAALLQCRDTPYIALDQKRKAIFSGAQLKSFDFIVSPGCPKRFLIDVKGRKLPFDSFNRGNLGQNWVTTADIEGLIQWEEVFGPEYLAVFVFAYWLTEPPLTVLSPNVFQYQNRDYFFVAVQVSSYRIQMRPRSSSWKTVSVLSRTFRHLAQPYDRFISESGCP